MKILVFILNLVAYSMIFNFQSAQSSDLTIAIADSATEAKKLILNTKADDQGTLQNPFPANDLSEKIAPALATDTGDEDSILESSVSSNSSLNRLDQSPESNRRSPEPATMFLFGTGLAGLVMVASRRRKSTY